MITLNNVSVIFEKRTVLNAINLELQEKRIGIIGANGSGKSTFLRLLNGLQIPHSGSVTIDGCDTKKDGKKVRQKVGFVFQNPDNQIVMPTVEEDLAFGLKNLHLDKAEITKRLDDIIKHYHLEDLRQYPSHLLSGGQKQLMAICGVLVMQPDIIVFDEPTTLLDLRNKKKIMATIHDMDQHIIMASHDLQYLEDFDRVIVFDKGTIAYDGAPLKAISFYENLMTQ